MRVVFQRWRTSGSLCSGSSRPLPCTLGVGSGPVAHKLTEGDESVVPRQLQTQPATAFCATPHANRSFRSLHDPDLARPIPPLTAVATGRSRHQMQSGRPGNGSWRPAVTSGPRQSRSRRRPGQATLCGGDRGQHRQPLVLLLGAVHRLIRVADELIGADRLIAHPRNAHARRELHPTAGQLERSGK